jgi:hypothetical protein
MSTEISPKKKNYLPILIFLAILFGLISYIFYGSGAVVKDPKTSTSTEEFQIRNAINDFYLNINNRDLDGTLGTITSNSPLINWVKTKLPTLKVNKNLNYQAQNLKFSTMNSSEAVADFYFISVEMNDQDAANERICKAYFKKVDGQWKVYNIEGME